MAASELAFSIRPARPDDAPELARLVTELGHPTTTAELAARWPSWAAAGNVALVAADAAQPGRLLGIAMLHRTDVLHRPRPIGRISALVVDSRHRGAGIGRALVAASEAFHAAAGCGLVEVTSNLRRADAHAFYEHLGYERTSYRFARSVERGG